MLGFVWTYKYALTWMGSSTDIIQYLVKLQQLCQELILLCPHCQSQYMLLAEKVPDVAREINKNGNYACLPAARRPTRWIKMFFVEVA